MSFVKAFETYQIRWNIEVLNKEAKQYLGLGGYQGRDFDGQVADCMLRGAFRHPERSEMSDVRSCKGKAVRTESKDLAPRHHFAFLISNFSFKRSFPTEPRD